MKIARQNTGIYMTEMSTCAPGRDGWEPLVAAKETVVDRWSVQAITSGILWVSSAGELVARAQIDSECILTYWH